MNAKTRDSATRQAQFYETQTENLGLEFISAVRRAYERLLEFPDIGRPFGRRLRRILVAKFLYGLLYRVESARIFHRRLMHLRRRPGYWRSRL